MPALPGLPAHLNEYKPITVSDTKIMKSIYYNEELLSKIDLMIEIPFGKVINKILTSSSYAAPYVTGLIALLLNNERIFKKDCDYQMLRNILLSKNI